MLRERFIEQICNAFKVHPVVAILGPRQSGKTTVVKQYLTEKFPNLPRANYFDLEDETDLARLAHPKEALEQLEGLVVIDEIQKIPELFPSIRVHVDKTNRQQHFLILGSASRDLIEQSSETLAGRIQYLELTPFSLIETLHLKQLWLRGGFPLSYLAENDEFSYIWRQSFVQTFLERDLPNLGIHIPPQNLRRFWMMIAHYHGNLLNASEIGRSLNINYKTVRNYLDILTGTFMLRELPPWFENISKRQVKSSKIYIRDSGLLHFLFGIRDYNQLLIYPKLGASWEGLALEEILRYHKAQQGEYYFWGTQAHAELDLLIIQNGKRLGFEFKYTDKPKLTKSMQIAIQDLHLDKLVVIYPGQLDFQLPQGVQVYGLENYLKRELN